MLSVKKRAAVDTAARVPGGTKLNLTVPLRARKEELMAPTAEENLEGLRKSSKDLNSLSDAATDCIRRLDSALEDIGPGVTVWAGELPEETIEAFYDTGHNSESTTVTLCKRVGYAKVPSKGWKLALECYHQTLDSNGRPMEDEFETKSFVALEVAPREDRLAAIPHLPRLIELLRLEVDRKIGAIKKEIESSGVVLKELGSVLNPTKGNTRVKVTTDLDEYSKRANFPKSQNH